MCPLPVSAAHRVDLLGVGVDPIDLSRAIAQLGAWRSDPSARAYVCVTPAHSLMDCVDDAELRAVYAQADMVTPDGMGVVYLLRLLGHRDVDRVYGPDLLKAATVAGIADGWRHYFLGGTDDVIDELITHLRIDAPEMQVAGRYAPPFRPLGPEESAAMIEGVNRAEADIVWVAFGSPRQERWMHANRDALDAPVLVGVGAAFDFLSGNKRQAPRWIQRSGFEWLFRLGTEPRRLWPRYRHYPRFVMLAGRQVLRARTSGLKR